MCMCCAKLSTYIIIAAIKRLYQNVRRTFVEQSEGKEEYVENQSKRRKYRSRRQRVSTLYYVRT